MKDIAPLMTRLPDPAPPPALAATVMARIARKAEPGAAGAPTAPARLHRERPAWPWALAGLGMVLCVIAWGWLLAGSLPGRMSPGIGLGGPALLPAEGPAALLLAFGLLLYLAGLFAPIGSGSRR